MAADKQAVQVEIVSGMQASLGRDNFAHTGQGAVVGIQKLLRPPPDHLGTDLQYRIGIRQGMASLLHDMAVQQNIDQDDERQQQQYLAATFQHIPNTPLLSAIPEDSIAAPSQPPTLKRCARNMTGGWREGVDAGGRSGIRSREAQRSCNIPGRAVVVAAVYGRTGADAAGVNHW